MKRLTFLMCNHSEKVLVTSFALLTLTLVGCQSPKGACCSQTEQPATTAEQKATSPDPSYIPGAAAPKPAQTNTAPPAATLEPGEQFLFDGKTMKGWKATDFAGAGEVEIKDGTLLLNQGVMTGANYTNDLPKVDYEVTYDACRVMGSDFFCSLTFPVKDSFCSLIVGGWGGGVVGLSSLDHMDASENETTKFINFENGKWYHFKVRVTKEKIEAWVDDDKLINVNTKEKIVSLRPGEIESSNPYGFATWSSSGAIKNVKLKHLDE